MAIRRGAWTRGPVAGLLAATALAIPVAGCGDDDSSSGDSTPAATDPEASFLSIRDCLQEREFRVAGGPKDPGDKDAPAFELVFTTIDDDQAGAFIALYESESEARRRLPAVKQNATRFEGLVESRGSITIVWMQSDPAASAREALSGCLPA
jgi:hypothetical protein